MKVCLKCGAETPLVSQLCHPCLRTMTELSRISNIQNMVCCKSCFSLKIPGTWIEFSDLESIDSDNLVSQSFNRAQFFERRSKIAALRVHRFWRDVNYNPIYKRARNNLLKNLKK